MIEVIWDGTAQPNNVGGWATSNTIQEQMGSIHAKKGVQASSIVIPQKGTANTSGQGNFSPTAGISSPNQSTIPPGQPPLGGMHMPPPPSMGMPPPHFIQPPMGVHVHPPPPPPQIPIGGVTLPSSLPVPPPPPPESLEPSQKKSKREKDLLPAEEFISKSSEKSLRAKVECPIAEKENIKLHGQVITIQMSLSDTVIQLKEKLEEAVGVKPNKQKLVIADGSVLKDQSSFAELNLAGDVQISLKLKERGGKK